MEKFNFKKKYGQNFLIDNNVLDNIFNSLNVTSNDLIIEVGPGSGNLTKRLKALNAQIIAYEIDLDTKNYLDKLENSRTKVIFGDFLLRNIVDDIKDLKYENLYVVANLPYYITTPIIEKIIEDKLNPKEMFLMVQKEVADRLSAKPRSKAYGYITVYLNYYYNAETLFKVSPKSFMPAPKVESAIIKLTRNNMPKSNNEEIFFQLIKDAFKHKRKNLNNNLNVYNKEVINKILNSHGLNLTSRAEEVPLEIFLEIADAL